MRSKEIISVIVPVYNVAEYLPNCLDSVIHQTYRNLEIILVDDGSTDTSGEICEKYASIDGRIRVIHQKNLGAAAARNTGISNASGNYIAFIDADDWLEINTFAAMLCEMGDADVITGGYWKEYVHSKEKIAEIMPVGTYSTEAALRKFYKNMMYSDNEAFNDTLASIWNKLFRTELVKKFYKKLDLSIRYHEDTAFVYTYFLQCKSIVVSDGAYYHYRIRNNSAVNSVYRLFLRDVNYLYLYLDNLFSNHTAANLLQLQLQKWFVELSFYGINEKMGFHEKFKIPIYHVPYQSKLIGKKIVLYGAGKVGKAYWRSLSAAEIKPVLWVDMSYKGLQQLGFPVEAPDRLYNCMFDYILIAVKEEEMARSIKANLEAHGVSSERILWKRPTTLF